MRLEEKTYTVARIERTNNSANWVVQATTNGFSRNVADEIVFVVEPSAQDFVRIGRQVKVTVELVPEPVN